MTALNGKHLRFLPISYTLSLFHKTSFDGVNPCLCWYNINILSTEVISFDAFFSLRQFETFSVTKINIWVASNALH